MIDIDELGHRAVADPPRAPSDSAALQARAQRRQRNRRLRTATFAMLLAAVGAGSAVVLDRGDQQPVAASDSEEVEVGAVFGQPMGRGTAIWPASGVSTETLTDTVTNEMLHWPGTRSEDPPPPEGGLTMHDPAHPDRRVVLDLAPSGDGWVVAYTYPSLEPRLDDGNLVALAGADLGPDAVTVELYRSDPIRQYRSQFTIPDRWDHVIHLPKPIPPQEAGSFLAVGRDANGRATGAIGLALGFPERLTVAIDRLVAASVPADLPVLAEGMFAGTDPGDLIDPSQARMIADVGPQLDLYLIPYVDRSGVWLGVHDGGEFGGLGGGGGDAAQFNANGWIVGESRGHSSTEFFTIYVLPDGIVVGDVGDAAVDPSGAVVYLEGLRQQDDFEISGGVFNLRR